MIDLQRLVFSDIPARKVLLEYIPLSTDTVNICVYRNHSFELIEHTIPAFLDYAGLKAKFSYSDYDDSLSFAKIDMSSDLIILWLDIERYKLANVEEFIKERISFLMKIFSGPILFVPFGKYIAINEGTVVTCSLSETEKRFGNGFVDLRMEPFTGTKISAKALLAVSKMLGLKYIPSIIRPALKAIAVDLDNTLYKGVLGEDGSEGLVLTDGHKRLQEHLKLLSTQGWMLCVISKNEIADVESLFMSRTDFPLKKEDFTVIAASWEEKAVSMEKILTRLNIGVSAMLFVDDNIGEIAAMQAHYPDIKVLIASEDGNETQNMLDLYPGLTKFAIKKEDAIRKADVQANEIREQIRQKLSLQEYIKSLGIVLTVHIDAKDDIARISELANVPT